MRAHLIVYSLRVELLLIVHSLWVELLLIVYSLLVELLLIVYSLWVELRLVALGRTRCLTVTPIGKVCRDNKIRNDERKKRKKR